MDPRWLKQQVDSGNIKSHEKEMKAGQVIVTKLKKKAIKWQGSHGEVNDVAQLIFGIVGESDVDTKRKTNAANSNECRWD